MPLMMDSSENPKRQANKFLVPVIASSSSESLRSPLQHQFEDVKGSHPTDPTVWIGDLDGVQETGAKTQPLPPQLPLTDSEAEVAGPDPGH
nr:unnamed protein product [Spirometra erinaceieuropaei]